MQANNVLANSSASVDQKAEVAIDKDTPKYLISCLQRAANMEAKVIEKAVVIKKRQEHLKHLAGIIQRINRSIEEENGFDPSKDEELRSALQHAADYELIHLDLTKDQYTARQRDSLLSDLTMAIGLLKDQTQMDFHHIQVDSRHQDQFLQMLSSISKQIRNMNLIPAKRLGA